MGICLWEPSEHWKSSRPVQNALKSSPSVRWSSYSNQFGSGDGIQRFELKSWHDGISTCQIPNLVQNSVNFTENHVWELKSKRWTHQRVSKVLLSWRDPPWPYLTTLLAGFLIFDFIPKISLFSVKFSKFYWNFTESGFWTVRGGKHHPRYPPWLRRRQVGPTTRLVLHSRSEHRLAHSKSDFTDFFSKIYWILLDFWTFP